MNGKLNGLCWQVKQPLDGRLMRKWGGCHGNGGHFLKIVTLFISWKYF